MQNFQELIVLVRQEVLSYFFVPALTNIVRATQIMNKNYRAIELYIKILLKF